MFVYSRAPDKKSYQWQVGFFCLDQGGQGFVVVEEYDERDDARAAVHFLNGGACVSPPVKPL